ncbi:MAG: hypothetical protein F6K00_23260 [Leptolyngbya sp. SIOISBB]|nr:hypothetical protein [Leptolyngbya sp. SIOISBB]
MKLASEKIVSTLGKSLFLASGKVVGLYDQFWQFDDRVYSQRFVCFPEAVTFFPIGESVVFWVELSIENSFEVHPDSEFAVMLPFKNSKESIFLGGGDEGELTEIANVSVGHYLLIYQERYMKQAEIEQLSFADLPSVETERGLGSFGPKICEITLVQTSTTPEAKVLKSVVRSEVSEIFLYSSFPP